MERGRLEDSWNTKGTCLKYQKKRKTCACLVPKNLRARRRTAGTADELQRRFRKAGGGSQQQGPSREITARPHSPSVWNSP